MKELANEFIEFSYKSPNGFFAVKNSIEVMKERNYKELNLGEKWTLENNQGYYININDSAFVAFEVGKGAVEDKGFRIVGSHTDSPGIKIKAKPELKENNYLKLNIEIYGGPILNTWLDRPLSIAGRVYTRGVDPFKPKLNLVDLKKPLLIIPNLAIHQNREVNKGVELNKQVDMLPIIKLIEDDFEKEDFLIKLLAQELNVDFEDILDLELYLYEVDKGQIIGLEEEFISAARIDNLASLYASILSVNKLGDFEGIKVIAAFDNEEIGSGTRQGADSVILSTILEKICYGLGKGRDEYIRSLEHSFMLSTDGAHAVHPNQASKTDPTNIPMINKGIAIKYSANFSYTTDANSGSIVKEIAKINEIDYQYFVNRSDLGGGSTIGPLSSKYIPIKSVDLGLPMLAMHSIRELCGVKDLYSLKRIIEAFLTTK